MASGAHVTGMEKKELDKLIESARSGDKNSIYRALVKLRTELVVDTKGIQQFRDAGGIAPLVRLLSKPYEKILEMALRILGNCCTQKDCCKQAIAFGIVPPLLTILKSIPNPRVQERVCRLLGNLARESNEKLCTLAKGIGVTMASVLEDSKDIATLCMAVRAIRLLWSEMPFCKEFVRFDGVDRILGILLRSSTLNENVGNSPKSIIEQNPSERGRVEFMEKHIPCMESVNSQKFDLEILKKIKAPIEKFKTPGGQSKQELFLFAELLKCLETVTQMRDCAIVYSFMQKKDSSSCIAFYANADSSYRAHALKILANLSESHGPTVLNEADAVTTACHLITSQELSTPLSEAEERDCVTVICSLADDACNRAKIRQSGAFKRLLELAKNTTSDSLLSMILGGLQNFRYDNMSIDLLIRMGLVHMLIKRLELNIKDLSESHNKNTFKNNYVKRSLREDCDDADDEIDYVAAKRVKIDYISSRFIPRNIDSPPASTSSVSISMSPNNSPCSSISQSPRSLSPVSTKGGPYDDIDDYSPVVSDIDEDQNDNANESNENAKQGANFDILQQILNEQSATKCDLEEENLMDADEPEEEVREKEPIGKKKKTEKENIIGLVLNILCSASYRLKYIQYDLSLCTPEILNTLVKTCKVAYKRRARDSPWDAHGAPLVLSHIISGTKNFVPLLKRDFIFRIYEMAQPNVEHENCSACTDLKLVGAGLLDLLTEQAETGYGRGEMIHLLLKEDKGMCKQVSIISALIIRDPKILNTLLLKHGSLYTIIELIVNKSEQLSNEAAIGLTALSKQLKIKIPKYNSARLCEENVVLTTECNGESNEQNIEEDCVTFVSGSSEPDADKPDNRARIRFSEETLTKVSDVFNRMFNSDFKESKNKEVVMKNQSIEGIKYFLDCVEQYSKERPLRRPVKVNTKSSSDSETVTPDAVDEPKVFIMAALEAYDICHVYLLPELEKYIFNMIIYLLDADNILDIFQFSMKHHKQELTELSINYFLTSNLAGDVKVRIFRNADDSDYYKEWNELILDTIVYTCQNLIS